MIQIENMYKVYTMGNNKIYALNNISLNIRRNEYVAIIGPSGSGKSTLMNMIGCLDTPTSGHYHLDGKKINKLSDNKLAEIRNQKIGFIFQGFNLLQKITALENVELPLIYNRFSSKDRKKKSIEALDIVGLKERINHKPNELSGGQQQRVAIARALVSNPPIILADEPTGNLDSKTGKEIMLLFRKLHACGNTIVLITHDINIANEANRIIRLHDGKIFSQSGVVADGYVSSI